MVSLLEEQNRKRLVSMWQEAFSDSEEYVNSFFDSRLAKTYVYSENDVPMGMVSVFDISLADKKGAYIYALVVDKLYRGKGVASALLEAVQEFLLTSGYKFCLVVPSPYEPLESFYKKFGFDRKIKLGVTKYNVTESDLEFDFQKATSREYEVARQKINNVVLHGRDFYNYIYDDLILEGVEILKIRVDSNDVFCVCYNKGEYVIIKELVGKIHPETVAQIVMRIFDVSKAVCISAQGEAYYPYALLNDFGSDFNFDFVYANLLLDDFENRF